jgi:predicted GTPase
MGINAQSLQQKKEVDNMTNSPFSLFRAVEQHTDTLFKNWTAFYADMQKVDTDAERRRLFAKLDQGFRDALYKLHQRLTTPELRIATTGTTSSGKSSIINLLAGAVIMPVEEREMSAGVVTLRHSSNGSRRLKIHKTPGAKWDCGEWQRLADADIKKRLTETMHKYNNTRNDAVKITPPKIELDYPLACFKSDGFLHVSGLPEKTRFSLIDLPGLRNVTDELNRQIIVHSREALCLVVYNMAETDEVKRQALVQEVLNQIKTMGGSPARMLFVLNRIDVFRKDSNWEKVEREEIERRKNEITKTLREHLPEHRKAIDQLLFARLSSAPALCSRRIIDSRVRINAGAQLDSHYSFLIPSELRDDLPRRIEKWGDAEFQRVSEAVWKTSYGAEFSGILRSHIEEHFEILVLPQIVARFEAEVNEAIGQALRSCNFVLNGSKESYEVAKDKLNKTDQILKAFLADARTQLMGSLKKSSDNSSGIADALELAVEDWMKKAMFKSVLPADALVPLYKWKDELSRTALDIAKAAAQSLRAGGIDFSRTAAATMPAGLQNDLMQAIRQFQGAGYSTSCATAETQKDKTHRAMFEGGKLEIATLKNGAVRFSEQLRQIIEEVLTTRIEVETARIQDALQSSLIPCYVGYLNTGLKQKAPNWGLNVPRLILKELSPPRIGTLKLEQNPVTVMNDECRNPWTLWIAKKEVDVAVIPNATDLERKWSDDIKVQMNGLLRPFSADLRNYLQAVQNKAEQSQKIVFDEINTQLDKEHRTHTQDYEDVRKQWEPLQRKAETLVAALSAVKEVVGMK